MADYYKLECSCGEYVAIRPNQAGQTVSCSCGKTLSVPSMIQIRNLETAPEDNVPQESVRRPIRFSEKWIVLAIGWGIFVPSICFSLYVLAKTPKPADVCWIQTRYTAGGNAVGRDTFPLSPTDVNLLVVYDPTKRKSVPLHPDYFDQMDFFHLLYYHKLLKPGPELSDNFYEKYERLKLTHQIQLGFGGVGVFVSLVLLLLGYLIKRPVKPAIS